MTQPLTPEVRNAVRSIIAFLTGLELNEDTAVMEILDQPIQVDEALAYIGALIILCQHLVHEAASASNVETVDVLRHLAEAIVG
jgi:hypothetical protein